MYPKYCGGYRKCKNQGLLCWQPSATEGFLFKSWSRPNIILHASASVRIATFLSAVFPVHSTSVRIATFLSAVFPVQSTSVRIATCPSFRFIRPCSVRIATCLSFRFVQPVSGSLPVRLSGSFNQCQDCYLSVFPVRSTSVSIATCPSFRFIPPPSSTGGGAWCAHRVRLQVFLTVSGELCSLPCNLALDWR